MKSTPAIAATLAVGLVVATLGQNAQAQTMVYGTNFESPSFSVGVLGDAYQQPASGQDGWQTTPREPSASAPSPYVLVSTQKAWSGSQSVQLVQSAQTAVIGGTAAMYRTLGNPGVTLNSQTDPFRLSMMLYLDQEASSDLPWALSLTTGGCCGLGMWLLPDNRVMYGHNLMNTAAFYTPGFSLKKTWLSVAIERDPVEWTALRLSIGNGSQTWQQMVSSPGGAMPIVSFGAVMPNFPVAAYGTAYVDDFQIGYNLSAVPEPGSWALLLVGGIALAGWPRRRRA